MKAILSLIYFLLITYTISCSQSLEYDPDAVNREKLASCKAFDINAQPTTYSDSPVMPAKGSVVIKASNGSSVSYFNLQGQAFLGPLSESKTLLKQLPTSNMFWFAFSVFFPGAQVYNNSVNSVMISALPSDQDKMGKKACLAGKGCIPSIGKPAQEILWVKPDSPDAKYLKSTDNVMGVYFNGKARAYPRNILWWHEIANDQIGDACFATVLCPLVGGVTTFDGSKYAFGVSGNLFNDNLVMFDYHDNDDQESYWPQLWMGAVSGPAKGEWLTPMPFTETTWELWKQIHPNTEVISSVTGYSRNYESYPYGEMRTDNSNFFGDMNPTPDSKYKNKTYATVYSPNPSDKTSAKAYVVKDLDNLLNQSDSKSTNTIILEDTYEFNDQKQDLLFVYQPSLINDFSQLINQPPNLSLLFEKPADLEEYKFEAVVY